MGPSFGLRKALQPWLNKGYGSLALIETMLLRVVLGHPNQTLSRGGNYQTHNSLWLQDLGTELVADNLD